MGACRYCGQPAGFLRSKHQACEQKQRQAWAAMVTLAASAAEGNGDLSGLRDQLASHAAAGFMPTDRIDEALVEAWERSVNHLLEDRVLTADEERCLVAFKDRFALSQDALDKHGAHSRVVKSAVLRDVMEGRLPQRLSLTGALPFNLQKGEHLIWLFVNTRYYEDRVRREYVGRSSGASIRIARGLYYRVGAFRGHPVDTTARVLVDTGVLGVTQKHVYFAGPAKAFRIRHDKIVSLLPFDDGVGLHRDAASAKPQIFLTGDGWFTYNLLVNVSHLSGV